MVINPQIQNVFASTTNTNTSTITTQGNTNYLGTFSFGPVLINYCSKCHEQFDCPYNLEKHEEIVHLSKYKDVEQNDRYV